MGTDLDRRSFLRGAFEDHQALIPRPPGALDSGFAQACKDCTRCSEDCPEQVISLDTEGRPFLDPTRGGCTFCGTCIEVCPTGALSPEHLAAWPWQAAISNTCLSMNGISCRLCQDSCAEQAIRFRLQTGGRAQPLLDPASCTGCGACVSICPSQSIALEQTATRVEGSAA